MCHWLQMTFNQCPAWYNLNSLLPYVTSWAAKNWQNRREIEMGWFHIGWGCRARMSQFFKVTRFEIINSVPYYYYYYQRVMRQQQIACVVWLDNATSKPDLDAESCNEVLMIFQYSHLCYPWLSLCAQHENVNRATCSLVFFCSKQQKTLNKKYRPGSLAEKRSWYTYWFLFMMMTVKPISDSELNYQFNVNHIRSRWGGIITHDCSYLSKDIHMDLERERERVTDWYHNLIRCTTN